MAHSNGIPQDGGFRRIEDFRLQIENHKLKVTNQKYPRLPMSALFGVLGALGASIILLRTSPYGVGIGSDETSYISMARNVADGNGFETYLGRYTANWPPLFPALLAVGVLLGLDAPDAARFLNAATFGLLVCLSGLYLARRVESRLLAVGVATALLVSPTLMSASSAALSDGPFLLLVLLSLSALDGHLHGGRRSALVWAAVFASLSVLTRYAGALVVAHGVLTLLLAGRNGRRGIAIYVLVTGVPISAWMVRNALTVGSVLGRWQSGDGPLAVTRESGLLIRECLHTLVDVMFHLYWGRSWIVQLLGDAGALMLLILGLAAAALGYVVVFRRWGGDRTKPVVLFWTFFLVVYIGGLIVVMLETSTPLWTPRYFMPSYVAFLFVTALLLDGVLRNSGTRGTCMRWAAIAALAAVLLNSVMVAAGRSVDETMQMTANGSKFTSKRWQDRPTIRYIKTHAIDGCIVSNVPDAVYIHADVQPAAFGFLPRNAGDRRRSIWDTTQFAERNCDVYLVWFEGEDWRRFSYGRREIASLPEAHVGPDAEVLLDDPDGMIWRLPRN